MREANRFRYAQEKLRIALMAAVGLTAMLTLVTWMVFAMLWPLWANWAALCSLLVFLAFFSLRSGIIYWRDDAVLAIMPSGISDKRFPRMIPSRHVEWSAVREIELVTREDSPYLILRLWANSNMPEVLEIEMSELEAEPAHIINAVTRYMPVRQQNEIG